MTVLAASLKAALKIVPTSLLAVVVYREVAQSPVTMQTVAVAFAGVCALAIVGAVVQTRDETKKNTTILTSLVQRIEGMEAHFERMARLVQEHEGTLGKPPARSKKHG